MKHLIAILPLLFPLSLWAQGNACYDEFAVDKTDGCAPFTVEITSEVRDGDVTYIYGDGTTELNPSESPLTHTYDSPGVYEFTRVVTSNCGSTNDATTTITITVYDGDIPPSIETKACLNSIELQITDNTYTHYQVWFETSTTTQHFATVSQGETINIQDALLTGLSSYDIIVKGAFDETDLTSTCAENRQTVSPLTSIPQASPRALALSEAGEVQIFFSKDESLRHILFEQVNNGEWQTVAFEENRDTLKISGRNAQDLHCYQLSAVSDCEDISQVNNPSQLTEASFSEVICSWPFVATAEDGGNKIAWENHPMASNISNWHIIRNGVLLETLSSQTSTYTDETAECNASYCYSIEVELSGGRVISMPPQCIQTLNTGKAITAKNIMASVEQDSLYVRWTVNAENISRLSLTKQNTGNTVELPLNGSFYIEPDFAVSGSEPFCYTLAVEDACANNSISDPFCSILLTGQKDGNENLLSWNVFMAGRDDVFYILERKPENADNWEEIHTTASIEDSFSFREDAFTIGERVNLYRVKIVIGGQADLMAYSNIVRMEEKAEVRIPDAFTPNDDGLNDLLVPFASNINEAVMRIYNRQGIEVFAGEVQADIGWNGKYGGNPQPAGAYVYIIEGTNTFGGVFSQKGTVMLIRP